MKKPQDLENVVNSSTEFFMEPLTAQPPVKEFTLRQHQLLIGCLLADGSIQAFKSRKKEIISARFYEKHSPAQKDICDFLYNELPFTKGMTQEPKIITSKTSDYVQVYTGKTPNFFPYLYNFYSHNNGHLLHRGKNIIKKVPTTISECLLTGTALAIWLAGDGSLRNHNHDLVLYTNNFEKPDQVLLQNALQQNFGVNAQIRPITRKSGKQEFVLWLEYDQALLFLDHCDSTVIENLNSVKSKFRVRGYGTGRTARRPRRFISERGTEN